jgi:hypothetical protein
MAQVWQRLAEQHADSTERLFPTGQADQLSMQQQQQVQPDEDKQE